MNEESYNEFLKMCEWMDMRRAEIEKKARADGTWSTVGLDANEHLFKDLYKELKIRLEEARKQAELKKID